MKYFLDKIDMFFVVVEQSRQVNTKKRLVKVI